MRAFRMVGTGAPDPRFAVEVIGYRMPIAAPVVADSAPSWFCFLFHQPVVVLAAAGYRTLAAGGVLAVGPGDRIEHRPASGGRMERSWIRCRGSAVAAAFAAAGARRREPCVLGSPDGAVDALLALHRACIHPRGAAPEHLLALFCAWLHVVVRDTGPTAGGRDGVAAARSHIESFYMLPQRLDDLAGMAGCSRAQFCRRFRRALGCSPRQYLLRLRLEAAHEQLLFTARGIADIAESCGFADRFHLSRAFSARYGMGPAACRRGA